MASSKFGDDSQVKFFYKHKFIGSSDPDNIDCPALIDLMESDKDAATQILNYMNHLGDPVFPVSEEDWSTPETNIDNVDVWELYSEFMKELDYEYADNQALGFGFLVDADFQPWDFEIFDGSVAEENVVESSTEIKASKFDGIPGYTPPKGGYLYIFKHGIGPGTIPDDVGVIKVKDLPNYYTAVWLDRFLTTPELKQYDIPDETRINELLGRIGYCQKNGDVVPCDDVTATTVESATKTPKFEVIRDDDGDISGYHLGNWYLMKIYNWSNSFNWYIFDEPKIHLYEYEKSKMSRVDDNNPQGYVLNMREGKKILLDRYNKEFGDDVQACRDIKAATEPNAPDAGKSKLARECIKQAKEIRDYFQSHNNNLNRRQEQLLEDLSDGIDSESIVAIREAIEGLKYNSKNMRNEQFYLIEDLYHEFNYAGGKFEGMGRPGSEDVDACDKVTGSTKYFANMVSASSDIDWENISLSDKVKFESLWPSDHDICYYFICNDAEAARQIFADRDDVDQIDGFTIEVSLEKEFSGRYDEALVSISPMTDDNGDQSDIDWDDITLEISDRDLKKLVSICKREYKKWAKSDNGEVKATTVCAGSFDSAYDENDELYKFHVAGYLGDDYRGLMDEWYTNDFEEALEHASDMGSSLFVEIENQIDGRSRRLTPEEWEDAAANGEYPDHIREDLAL